MEHIREKQRLETRKEYATIFTPLVTTVVLGLTLAFQAYQFIWSERDKREASEDAQWAEAVKQVSQASKVSPVAVILNPFLKSRRYAELAKKTAIQFLASTHDQIGFSDLFRSAFSPVDWTNFDSVAQLDRALGPRLGELWGKTYVKETDTNELNKLADDDEKKEFFYLHNAITEISTDVAPLLKSARPFGKSLDLRSAWFYDADWRGVDLSGADLTDADLRLLDLKNGNLGEVRSFSGLYIHGVAWWQAKQISPELLSYLMEKSPYDPNSLYGPNATKIAPSEYAESLTRLQANR